MTEKTLYKIEFKDGLVVTGTAREIVTALRRASRMEYDMSNLRFKVRYSRRHKIVYGKRLHVLLDRDFIQDLAASPSVEWFFKVKEYSFGKHLTNNDK